MYEQLLACTFACSPWPVQSKVLRFLHADSVTAGGRVRRKRGFRSYVAATLALPDDAVAGLTAVGSSLAMPEAAGQGVGS